MGFLRIFFISIRFILWVIYLWIWILPTRFTVLSIGVYLILVYAIFGTVSVQEIKTIFNNNETAYFLGFNIPFALPMFIAFICAFAESKQSSGKSSLEQAIGFRNAQMRVKTDIQASKILRKTAYLDMLNSDDSDIFLKSRRGFEAEYGNSNPTEVFNDLMKDD